MGFAKCSGFAISVASWKTKDSLGWSALKSERFMIYANFLMCCSVLAGLNSLSENVRSFDILLVLAESARAIDRGQYIQNPVLAK